jgi:DNA end-binding protein Ku
MEALRRSVCGASAREPGTQKKPTKKRKAAAGQKEMLTPIVGKKPAREGAAKKPSAGRQRKSA